MNNLTVWLMVGSLTGWLISVVIRTEAQATVGFNVLAGTVGAILGGLMLTPLVGTGSVSALLTSCKSG